MENIPAYKELRSKFVCAKTARRLIKENGLKFRHGFFSTKEVEATRGAVAEFLDDNGLAVKDLENWLVEDAEFPRFELAKYVTSRVPYRTFKSIITFITWWYNPLTKSKFSEGDDLQLVELVNQKGFRWKEIGMVLEKWRDQCRHRFLRLKGLEKKKIHMKDIKQIVRAGIPTSEAEWTVLCTRMQVSKALLTKYINQYLKRMPSDPSCDAINNITLCAYILVHNFYCTVSIDLRRFVDFLRNGALQYVEQEGACDSSHPEGERARSDPDALRAYFDLNFHGAFSSVESLDLGVEVETDDIFWINIINEFHIESQDAKSRFYALVSSHGIRTFGDLYKTLGSLSWDCFSGQVRQLVLTNSRNG